MSALQALVNQTQAAANKKAAAKPAADKAASKASAKPAKGNGKANKAETAKPETQAAAPESKPAKAPKAEKPATLRTIHVLKYTGADGQPASVNYTRFSRMVKDMRARLENGETCEINRTKAPVETVIVDGDE